MTRRPSKKATPTTSVVADFRVVILDNPEDLVRRLTIAARKGGASEDDLIRLADMVTLLRSFQTKAQVKRKQESIVRARNARLCVTEEERAAVTAAPTQTSRQAMRARGMVL